MSKKLIVAVVSALIVGVVGCGDDDDDTDAGDGTSATEAPAATSADTEAPTATSAGTEAPDTTSAVTSAATDGTTADTGAEGGVTVTDADGELAQEMADQLAAAAASPLEAEGEPIVVGFVNTEGDPVLTYPDVRLGIESAVDFVNTKLGGVGADLAAGTPGRPLELLSCQQTLAAASAQSCANEIAQASPMTIFIGVDPLTAVQYPAFAGIPAINLVPIADADFKAEGTFAFDGGCAVLAGDLDYMVRNEDVTSVAWLVSKNGGGAEYCATYGAKAADALHAEGFEFEYQEIPWTAGQADLSNIAQSVIDSGADFVFLPLSDVDCGRIWDALGNLGYEGKVFFPEGCLNPEIVEANSDFLAATGAVFNSTTYLSDRPDLYDEGTLVRLELDTRLAELEDEFTDSPVTSFALHQFGNVVTVQNAMNAILAEGGELTTETIAEKLRTENLHTYGGPPAECGAFDVLPAICGFNNTYYRYLGVDEVEPLNDGEPVSMLPILEASQTPG